MNKASLEDGLLTLDYDVCGPREDGTVIWSGTVKIRLSPDGGWKYEENEMRYPLYPVGGDGQTRSLIHISTRRGCATHSSRCPACKSGFRKGARKMAKLSDLQNIGKVLEARLVEAGVDTPETLRELGSREALVRLRCV